MITYLERLDEGDVTAVATATHTLWGGARTLAQHVDHTHEAISRSHGVVSMAGLREGDTVVSSLQQQQLTLATPTGDVTAVGIGRVYTNDTHRGRGLARMLIERVMAQSGLSTFVVFADIDPTFYAALGFETLSHVSWTARTDALPNLPGRLEPTADVPRLVDIFDRSWRASWLRVRRTEDSWRYAAWRRGTGDAFLVGENDYVVARLMDRTLWIDDAATTSISRDALWASLRSLAAALGATHVSGWLRPDHAGGPFVATGRKTCIPMIKSDLALEDVRAHFSSLDRV